VKILFVLRSTVYVRNFESTIRLLAEHGHRVHLVAPEHRLHSAVRVREAMDATGDGVTYGPPPDHEPFGWALLGETLRRAVDYLRYLGAAYRDAPKLRARAERTAPAFVIALLRWRLLATAAGRALLGRLLRYCDHALPCDPAIDRFLREQAPDLVLVTPLVEPGSPQATYVRSARAAGIPTGLCVYSWDNLTNKGLIQHQPDVVTVWNEAMKNEAIELHGVPADRIVVTGATAYDQWFSWQPRWTREEFCARVGLPSDRPYLLYVCSSKFIAPEEVGFVRRWVEQVRESSEVLRDAGVLVRPHPQNGEQWQAVRLNGLDDVVVWPPVGQNPIDGDSKSEYYDSIFHSAAVVGVNTSAQIESAIVGRSVHTVLAPEFRDTQAGTLHFSHIGHDDGGLLHVGADMRAHVLGLERAIQSPRAHEARSRAFLERFVRPFGLDAAASPRLVAALERAASQPVARAGVLPLGAWVVRRALGATAARYERDERRRRSAEARRAQARQARGETLEARRRTKESARQQARQERRERLLRRRAEKEQAVAARGARAAADRATAARAYDNFLSVREHVRRMQQLDGREPQRRLSEQRMLSALGHLWDATADVIAALRHHTAPISGLSPDDYANPGETRKAFFTDLRRLVKVGNRALVVPESPLLGGFGHVSGGAPKLYNDDTLKYYEVLSALECGAILDGFRTPGRPAIVWEIGGGWGGFAYQFKTLFPSSTYVITAPPELLLVSAVYLMTAFPQARCRFFDECPGPPFWRDLTGVDFAFATETAIGATAADHPLSLTLDLQALEQMPAERACAHVRAAFALESRYLYSLGPRDVADDADLTSVAKILERLYWAYEIPVPQYYGMKVLAGFRGREPADGVERVHRLGWRRLRV
jgi:hypothetical protein